MTFSIPSASSLVPRGSNLVYSPVSLRLVQAQMLMLANDLQLTHWNVNQLYSQIVGCFTVYGMQRDRIVTGPLSEQWTSFLAEDEKEILHDLDQSDQRLAELIQSNRASSVDITEFRRYRARILLESKRKAEKRIAAFIVNRAKGCFACWDLIRRLRNPVETVSIDAFSIAEHFAEVLTSRHPLFWT